MLRVERTNFYLAGAGECQVREFPGCLNGEPLRAIVCGSLDPEPLPSPSDRYTASVMTKIERPLTLWFINKHDYTRKPYMKKIVFDAVLAYDLPAFVRFAEV